MLHIAIIASSKDPAGINIRSNLIELFDFKKVNEICFKLGVFSKKFFKKIEKIRNLRNKIHIQGLSNLDRSYTKKELEFISSIMNDLLGKLNIKNNGTT